MSRSQRRWAVARVEEELDLLPLMNLFVVLIPMLLLSAVFVEMSVIRMDAPSDTPPASERTPLGLSVAIGEASWTISGRNVDPVVVDRAEEGSLERLRAELAGIAGRFPDDHDVVIRSRESTRYEDIVMVMDVSRETGFPGVSLTGGEP
jgi:biopolymer transport protein ExbD